jgi:hypothetical protein
MTIRPTRAHPDPRCARRWRIAALASLVITALPVSAVAAGTAQADAVAYLVNVTVRPGYHFADADVEHELATTDEYQATYLLGQAANELCPAQIWRLRRSAADSHIQ